MAFGSYYFTLYGTAFLVVIGGLWNAFNFITTMLQQWKSGGMQTVSLIICSISLGNVFMHISTFTILASVWAGVMCQQDLPLSFSANLYVWLSSTCMSFWSVAWLSVLYCVKVVSFSSKLFRALKKDISTIIDTTLLVTFLISWGMFTPFFTLHYHDELYVTNASENATCVIKTPLFSAWIDLEVYAVIFICYLALLPLMIMLPTSVRLVVHLCKHTLSMRKNQNACHGAQAYLLLCRLIVSLVGVYLITLVTISLYYFRAVFASALSPNMLHYGYSFYCIVSAVLLTMSNKYLRERFQALFCSGKESNATLTKSVNDKSSSTGTV